MPLAARGAYTLPRAVEHNMRLTTRQARKMARLRKTYGAGPGRPRSETVHGTHTAYRRHGCRCDVCRAFLAAYERSRLGGTPRPLPEP